jgi:hypothetical protein
MTVFVLFDSILGQGSDDGIKGSEIEIEEIPFVVGKF